MATKMSDIFNQEFPMSPEDIVSPPKKRKEKILANLTKSLALAQDDYEKKLRPPSEIVMNRAMTE